MSPHEIGREIASAVNTLALAAYANGAQARFVDPLEDRVHVRILGLVDQLVALAQERDESRGVEASLAATDAFCRANPDSGVSS